VNASTAIVAVAVKDLRLLARDRTAFVFTFLFPVALAMFFGVMFSGGGDGPASDIEIAVLDEGQSPAAQAFIAALTAPGEGLVAHVSADRDACEARVRGRDALACLLLPADFQGGVEAMLTGHPLKLTVVVDPSRRAEAGLLTGKLMASGYRQLSGGLGDPAQMTATLTRARALIDRDPAVPASTRDALAKLYSGLDAINHMNDGTGPEGQVPKDSSGGAWQPLVVETRALQQQGSDGPPNAFSVSFPQGVAWGLMSCVLAFIGAMVRERSSGTLLRLTAAPISTAAVVAGKSLACFLACVSVQLLILGVGRLGFGVTIGQPGWMALAILCASLGFTGLTLLMAGLSRSEEGAGGIGRAALTVLALIGGGAVPLAFMPPAMLTASNVSPFKWAVLAFEGALWRGFTPAEMLPPLAVLLAIAVVGFVAGTLLLRRMRGA
jgi:ABC-2 type transport system permease protein